MEEHPPPRDLARVLTVWDAAALIVGIVIGSGIFATPPLVLAHLPSTGASLAVWALGGGIALCGALCFAELAAMFPHTGGSFVFLRRGYGRFPAFAYGWSALLVTYPASIAAVSVVFTAYLARWVPLSEGARPWVAAGTCLALTAINILGVRLGAFSLRLITLIKVLAMAAIFIPGLFMAGGKTLAPLWAEPAEGSWLTALALSLVAVLWTYEGWSDGPTLAGEVRDRERDVVRALILGTCGVTVIYLLTNLAYLRVLGVDGVRATDSVAVDMAEALFGRRGSVFVTGLVIVSTLGAILGMIVGASRVFFAMSREGLFFSVVGRVHPRFGSPAAALVLVGAVSALYALVGSFETIIQYFVFVSTLWFILIVFSVILHRRRSPTAPRPFRIPLYPLPPLLFLAATVGLVVKLWMDQPREAGAGLIVVLASVPAYFFWERHRRR